LYGVASSNATIRGMKLSLPGLGDRLPRRAAGRGLDGSLALPLLQLTSIHLGWGFVGWSVVLLAAVAFVVVPMFQMTPAYPEWFAGHFSWTLLALLSCGVSPIALAGNGCRPGWQTAVLAVAAFAALTLQLQSRSKRTRFDATQHYWRLAMLSTLASCVLSLAASICRYSPSAANGRCSAVCWHCLAAGLSVMIGMLYKIVPFLVWLHLQNLGGGRVLAPNMNKVIAARQIDRQMYAHFLALALLLATAFWPGYFSYPAGLALLLANAWLLRNLLTARACYRQQRLKIAIRAASTPAEQGPR
jgi:hypothetical protein